MRKFCFIASCCAIAIALPIAYSYSQSPGGRSVSKSTDIDELVSKMMAFDADKDGHLTLTEVTDTRLVSLFNRADADKDGKVTKAELTALGEKEYVAGGGGGGFGGGPGGPGGGPGGPGGPPMSRPGEVIPPMLMGFLKLTDAQKTEMAALQKDVDTRLDKILNDEQKSMLKQMSQRGPGGPGGRGRGPGGPGGPGGGPGGPGGRGGRPGGPGGRDN
jgi:hypothetical protein